PDYTDTVFVDIRTHNAGMFNSFPGCYNAKLRVSVHFFGFFLFKMIQWIKVLYLAGKLGFKLSGIKKSNWSGTAHTFYKVFPVIFGIISNRRNSAKTGNNYSF